MAKNKSVKIGWAFMRVSTTDQAETQHGSLEQQRNMIDRWAHQKSEDSKTLYRIDRYVEEDRSGRGKSLHLRKSLPELENAIRNGKIDFFVIEKIDRLSRDQIYNLTTAKLAQEHGVEIHEYESGLVDLKDRGKRLGFNIKNMMAEEYSLELEEKITKKLRETMVNNGKDASSVPVLGLDKHSSMACFYVINPKEQKIAIAIFEKFLELGSIKATAQFCNKNGYRTKTRTLKEKIDKNGRIIPAKQIGGESFDEKYLRRLLSSEKLRGFNFFKDTWNQFPRLQDENGNVRWEYGHFRTQGPVVPQELWDQVQSLLKKNKQTNARARSETTVYLLSGILHKRNGGKVTGASAKSGANLYYEDRREGEFRIPKDEIEKIVCARVKSFLKDSGIFRTVIAKGCDQRNEKADAIDKSLKSIEAKISDLARAKQNISEHLRTEAVKVGSDLAGVAKILSEESGKLDSELAALTADQERLLHERYIIVDVYQEGRIEELLGEALKDFDQRCDLEKKQIIQAIIPKIVIHEGKLELYFNFVGLTPRGERKPGGKKFDLVRNGSGRHRQSWRFSAAKTPSHIEY